jgi:hypothetical protein
MNRQCANCGADFVATHHWARFCPEHAPPKKVKTAAATVDIADTPEFKAAVEAVKQEVLAAVARQVVAAAPAPAGDSLQITMEKLALTIGDLTNQNSGQKLVSPEVLADRRKADRDMRERIERAVAEVESGDEDAMPRYRLVSKIQAPLLNGDELIEPMRRGADNLVVPTELNWPLPPNLAMLPLNGPAKEIFALFKESIGNQASVRVSGISGKGAAAEPVFASGEDRFFVTNQGRNVTTGTATMALHNATGSQPSIAPAARGRASIHGQDPMRQGNGPPTIQVRVLGTIAPPAVQNG